LVVLHITAFSESCWFLYTEAIFLEPRWHRMDRFLAQHQREENFRPSVYSSHVSSPRQATISHLTLASIFLGYGIRSKKEIK